MTCWSCGTDLSQIDGDAPPVDALPVQRALLKVAGQGWCSLGEYGPVYSFAVFQVLAVLARILASGRHAHAIQRHLTEPGGRCATAEEISAAKETLNRRGQPATRRKLVELFGAKPAAIGSLADPAGDGAAWGRGRYWKVDGVSPEVKAAARQAAHRAGEGVGPWLDALLRRQLNLPVQKSPCACQSPDTFAADGIQG